MTNEIKISQQDFNDFAWTATRYVLGRNTYAVTPICRALIRNAEKLFAGNRYQIQEEIASAINSGNAGMAMDIAEWEKVLTAFSGVVDDKKPS